MTSPALRVGSLRGAASPEAGFSASRALAGILQTLAAEHPDSNFDNTASALRHWARPCLEGRGLSLRAAFSQLDLAQQAALRRRLGTRVEEFLALSEESDPALFGEALSAMAGGAARAGEAGTAILLYDFLSRTAGPLAPRLDAAVRARAEAEARALRGEGAFGARFEHLSRGFARQAADPAMIAGMGIGSLVAGAVRLGVLSRLASARTANFFTRGAGASFSAGTAAWAAEVPAFWMTTRALHAASSETPLAWDRAALTRELGSTALMLGLLKAGGAATNALFHRAHGIAPFGAEAARLAPFTGVSRPLFAQAGMLGGVYADHLIEERLGWRPAGDPTSRLFDSFATLLQFHVGGRLAGSALGPRYAASIRELEVRSRMTELRNRPALSAALGLEGLGPRPVLAEGGDLTPPGGWILAMSELKPERARSPRGRRVAPEPMDSRVGERSPEHEGEAMLRAFRESPASGVDRLLKGLQERGQLAPLALALEAEGLRPGLKAEEAARAREVLRDLEGDFWNYLAEGRERSPIATRWELFRAWQNELVPKGMAGFLQLQQRLRSIGISDVSAMKNGEIRIKNRVRDNPELADYYLDLSLVRGFLRERGFNQVDENNSNGRYLSHLLLHGDGNCVTLSLLFAHLTAQTGRSLQAGLLPRHVYLLGREGAAIESILDFGIASGMPYRHRAIEPEAKPLGAHALMGVHLLNLGKELLEGGDLAAARQTFLRARDILPRSPRADLFLAQAAQRQGDFGATLDHYRRAHALHPTEASGLTNLRMRAWERFQAKQYGEAEAAFRRINNAVPEDIDALHGLELTYRRMGLREEADGVANLIEILRFDAE